MEHKNIGRSVTAVALAAAFVLLVLVQVILFLPWEIARRRHNK